MKNSISRRLFIQCSAIILAFAIAIMVIISFFLEDYYLQNEKNNLSELATRIVEVDLLENEETFENIMASYESRYNVIIDIYKQNGESVYTTFYNHLYTKPNQTPTYRPRIMKVISRDYFTDGSYFDVRFDKISNTEYIVYVNEDQNGLNVELFVQKSALETSAKYANNFIMMITFCGFLISLIWAFLFSKRFTKPLIQMNEITAKMKKLDFSEKCDVKTKDEIGELSNSINELSDSLFVALEILREKNEKLEHDIQRERELEKNRKEFIANVSHELKTPIAIIQGYAEGLQFIAKEDPERCDDYAEVIIDESKRMNNMVLDLLELSKYETGHMIFAPEKFDIFELLNKVSTNHAFKFKDNNITATVESEQHLIGFGDVDKLEQVLNNYISNAISHISGKKEIKIICTQIQDFYRIGVFNTGKTIPVTEMKNVWGSFYRSDKSHKREDGRIGLGLSIVCAIQQLHGMGYGVTNCDDGIIFWFDIKKDK